MRRAARRRSGLFAAFGRWASLLLLLVIVCGAWFTNYASQAYPAPPDFEVVTAPRNRPLEVVYGPSRLVIDSGSQVVLPRTGRDADREVTLQRGRVTARVQPLAQGRSFAVRTPQAVAGVRGTVFHVALDQRYRTTVSVDEGKVEVAGLVGDPILLLPGQAVRVSSAEPAMLVGGVEFAPVPTALDLPMPAAYRTPREEPAAPDHTSRASTSVSERDAARADARDFARGGESAAERARRELMMRNAASNNPNPQNPEPRPQEPRSLR